jgi:Restriction endonuclease
VGHVFRKDGGIDIVAYPRCSTFPFLLGVQVKHHRSRAKTGVSDVRDFHGVLTAGHSPFHMGIIATNTTFTFDAQWFAENNQRIMRLRDLKDLQRWLRYDFMNDCEWREIPERIQLAPRIFADIPRPTQRIRRAS